MTETETDYRVRVADWEYDQDWLRRIRSEVFVSEQGVPEHLEWDGKDRTALHLIAEDRNGKVIGTARLLRDGRIGRMAVVASRRRSGIGSALLTRLLDIARHEHLPEVHLHAQCDAVAFYQRFGFEAEGDVFEEAGIPHQAMRLAVQ
jgi:predicted GNAT family N-acyltransferase